MLLPSTALPRLSLVDLIEALRRSMVSGRHHTETLSPVNCVRSPFYTELYKHVFHMRLHRLRRDAQRTRNFLVGLTSTDKLENVAFAWT